MTKFSIFSFNVRAVVCALMIVVLLTAFSVPAVLAQDNRQHDMHDMQGMDMSKPKPKPASQQKKKPAPKKDEMQGMDMSGMEMKVAPSPAPSASTDKEDSSDVQGANRRNNPRCLDVQ